MKTNAGVIGGPGVSVPDDRYRSGRFTEPPCQQEQQETAEMASIGFPDSAIQVSYDSLQYGILEVVQERGRAPGGGPVFVQTGFMKFHGLVLLSHFMSLACLTKIYARKDPMTI
jgi:hypothetical protein